MPTAPFKRRCLLNLLGLEDRVQKGAQQSGHSEGAADHRAHAGDELVEALSLADNRHGHGRQVVAETSLGHIFLLVLVQQDRTVLYGVDDDIAKHPETAAVQPIRQRPSRQFGKLRAKVLSLHTKRTHGWNVAPNLDRSLCVWKRAICDTAAHHSFL
jgi:hypothetical protein